jgi:hypothetical protein
MTSAREREFVPVWVAWFAFYLGFFGGLVGMGLTWLLWSVS